MSCTCKALIPCCCLPCVDTFPNANWLKLYWIWWMSFICSKSFRIAETSLIFVAMYLVSKREASARHNFLSRLLSCCYILENDVCYVWFHSDNCFLMLSSVLRCDVSLGKPTDPISCHFWMPAAKRKGKPAFFWIDWKTLFNWIFDAKVAKSSDNSVLY